MKIPLVLATLFYVDGRMDEQGRQAESQTQMTMLIDDFSNFAKAPKSNFSKYKNFGGLEVACWPMVLKFATGRSRRIFRAKKSSLRRGSKAVGPMS
jgi:hypothetical protein